VFALDYRPDCPGQNHPQRIPFHGSKAEVVAVEVPDQPAGLSGILDVLDKLSVNVEYM
jgi:hypothetical protein